MKNKPDEIIDAGGGVVYRFTENDNKEVVLIKRRGVWDLPKGKRELKETPEMCAVREVAEEIGISKPGLEKFIIKTYHEY
ncbi:MAG: NUDIX domain-containing protein, partial [Balneolaceae bacterium]